MCPEPSPSQLAFDPARELAFARAVLAGSEAAIVTFEERMLCVPRILGALNRRRGRPLDDHDVADLVQDTIVVVLRKLDEFAAYVPLEGWIYRLCYLEFLNAVRRRDRRRQRAVELDEVAAHTDAKDVRHDHDDLHEALARVGGAEAETIRMKHFAELTFQEIGAMLGMPANTAKTRYYRGMAKLAELLRATRSHEERAG